MRNTAATHEHRVIKVFIPSIAGFEAENCNPSHRKMILRDLNSPGAVGCDQKQVLRACGAQDDMLRGSFRERKGKKGTFASLLVPFCKRDPNACHPERSPRQRA